MTYKINAKTVEFMNNSVGKDDYTKVAELPIDKRYLRKIYEQNEVIYAVFERGSDDIVGSGWELHPTVDNPDKKQFDTAMNLLEKMYSEDPNWVKNLIIDKWTYGMAGMEISTPTDPKVPYKDKQRGIDVWLLDENGVVENAWVVNWYAFSVIVNEYGELPEPPHAAYIQQVGNNKIGFDKNKILVVKHGRRGAVGMPPLMPLFNVIADQIKLSNYAGNLYSGKVPKRLIGVDAEADEIPLITEAVNAQIKKKDNPFGLVFANLPDGKYQVEKLVETPKEQAFLDMLYYYREEICAVFGIPPIKMGWVQTGKLANPEQQLDSWYDKVESEQRLLSVMINTLLEKAGVTDYAYVFNSPRPKKEKEMAEILVRQAGAVVNLLKVGAISINEARAIIGLPPTGNKEDDVNKPVDAAKVIKLEDAEDLAAGEWDFFLKP